MIFMICFFGFFALFIICYSFSNLLLDMRTKKLLKEHQEEWDKIKAELEEKGADYIKIADAYSHYVDRLICTRDARCGACFPSF